MPKCLNDKRELFFLPAHKDANMHVKHADVWVCPKCGRVHTKEDLGLA